MKYGFDNAKYLKIQSEHIKDRIATFGDKLYMEFGGKLFDDYHASRVLPGFEPDSKLKMLMQMKDDAEIVIVISAVDIQKNKVRTDLGSITTIRSKAIRTMSPSSTPTKDSAGTTMWRPRNPSSSLRLPAPEAARWPYA